MKLINNAEILTVAGGCECYNPSPTIPGLGLLVMAGGAYGAIAGAMGYGQKAYTESPALTGSLFSKGINGAKLGGNVIASSVKGAVYGGGAGAMIVFSGLAMLGAI